MGQPRDGGGPFPAADAAKVARISNELRDALAADPPPSVTGTLFFCLRSRLLCAHSLAGLCAMAAVGPAGFTFGKL